MGEHFTYIKDHYKDHFTDMNDHSKDHQNLF